MLKNKLKMLKLLLLLTFVEACAAQDEISLSVFTVTSKSLTVQWNGFSGASSYKITATPKNSPEPSVFAQFGGNTVIGSVNSLSPNTVYTTHLEAMDNAFNVLSSAEAEVTTAPEVPSIEQAYSKTSDSITVEFTEVAGATSYILRAESVDGEFFSETEVMGSPGTVVNLQPYTDYRLSVLSLNSKRRSQPSSFVEARTVVMAPKLNTTSPDNDTIAVVWAPVEHAVLYMLCIIREGASSRQKLNTTETMVTFSDLEPGTTYCIKGTAWDAEGRSGDDLTVCQITRPPSPDVTMVEVSHGRVQGILVYWGPVQGAEEYHANSSDGRSCTSSGGTHCNIMPVTCGESHSVSVSAINNGGPSVPSPPEDYITYPCPPKNIWVEEPTPGNCIVLWDQVSLVEYYITFIKRDDGEENLCNTTDTNCTFSCMCGYTYVTSVLPYNRAGSSHLAPSRNYTTIPCCPESVAIDLISTETLKITWPRIKGAELYQTTAVGTDDVIHCNDTAAVCALSNLKCDMVYSVTVTPCSDLRGCNLTCELHTHKTAPCAPEIINMTQTGNSSYRVFYTMPNNPGTQYIITAYGHLVSRVCYSSNGSCDLTYLPCGENFEVMAVAKTAVGKSLPGFSKHLETGPCCPSELTVTQVTQAMTNVTWSAGTGARSYITSLTSPRGNATCHTLDNHCVMGCITCGTNYSVHLEAISSTGHKSECNYHGYSSSPCCPVGLKLYRRVNESLRVCWRSLGPWVHQHIVELYGTAVNYSCIAEPSSLYCDIQGAKCGEVYTVEVAPVNRNGVKVDYCQHRMFSVSCAATNAVMINRRRRSLH